MFKLIDSNKYYLPNTQKQWMHLGTATSGLREFMCFVEVSTQKTYIEEITYGQLEFIADESLAKDLNSFFIEKGILNRAHPLIPDNIWYKLGKK